MNKIIYTAAAGICSMILSLGITQPTAAALFSQCDNYINIHQSPYIQSTIVGYIYNDSIATILEEGQEDWIKIQSGNVIGWVSKIYFIEADESTKGYTVAKIHPEDLYVRTAPNKDANIYMKGRKFSVLNIKMVGFLLFQKMNFMVLLMLNMLN